MSGTLGMVNITTVVRKLEIISFKKFYIREAFKNKNHKTYEIFHMWVDPPPPPPPQHMENISIIFYCV